MTTEQYKIVMIIKPGGEIETTIEGLNGPVCEEKAKWLDNLGKNVRHTRNADYYAHASEQTTRENVTVGTGNNEGGNHGTPW